MHCRALIIFDWKDDGVTEVNELVKGRRGVTADSARDLAKVLGTSPELWMNLQVTWDLRRAGMRRKAS